MELEKLKNISIEQYLEVIGLKPTKIQGDNIWYLSPFREESTPSFKLSRSKNMWYDFGMGKGGNIFELTKLYYNLNSFPEIAKRIEQNMTGHEAVYIEAKQIEQTSTITIIETCQYLDRDMIYYMVSRGIKDPDVIYGNCVGVKYRLSNKDSIYRAIGFKNNSGGYELRNKYFKGSSSPKDITLINNSKTENQTCLVFEGFMDYLSHLVINGKLDNCSYLILNSVSFAQRALEHLAKFRKVYFYLDNDNAGQKTTSFLMENLKGLLLVDKSIEYKDSKDVNEYLCKIRFK